MARKWETTHATPRRHASRLSVSLATGNRAWRRSSRPAISEAAKELNEKREAWLNPPDASEAELKKRTLTNLYNARPTWLANLHAQLDRAVWAAYGWDDEDPETVDEETILTRLLKLNRERAGRRQEG